MADVCLQFNRGQPNAELLGHDLLAAATAEVFSAQLYPDATPVLNYGPDRGSDAFRHALAAFLNAQTPQLRSGEYAPVASEVLFATAGNSHALGHICLLLFRAYATSTIICEVLHSAVSDVPACTDTPQNPTYPFALTIFRDHKAHLVSVLRDGAGQTDVDAVRARCIEAREQGRPVAFLYLVPSYHNPTGQSLSDVTRKQLVELAHELDFWLVCDDVYQLLPFDANRPPPAPVVCHEVAHVRALCVLHSLTWCHPAQDSTSSDACRVVSLGSFSKLLAPALRVVCARPYRVAQGRFTRHDRDGFRLAIAHC